jgi:hypothetical protein
MIIDTPFNNSKVNDLLNDGAANDLNDAQLITAKLNDCVANDFNDFAA